MLRTPALESISLLFAIGGGPERIECEAPVMPDTLLALLLRPLMLDTGSVKGIVPPFASLWSKRVTSPRSAIQKPRDGGYVCYA